MKILFVPDILDWAIGHLSQSKVKYLPHFNCRIIPVHPRDAVEKADWFLQQVEEFKPDIIVYEYFRSCAQLIQQKPQLKEYKSILVHHNQRDKSLFYADWNELGIDKIVTHTTRCREKLMARGYTNVEVINHGIDVNFFEYSEKEPEEPTIGYIGRIVPWKGLKEIAECAEELGYPVQVMGKMDKADYWEQIPKSKLRFDFLDCPDEERINAMRNMTIYVGNSEDDYEEGTMPYLEAMASGVPVVTTPNGIAKDIAVDRQNALVVPFKDKTALKEAIKELMENPELRKTLRRGGWDTVKLRNEQKMAWDYSKLFMKLLYPNQTLVSAIIPTTVERASQVQLTLKALSEQTYPAIEAIIIWDDLYSDIPIGMLDKIRDESKIVVKQFVTNREGYNLAMARNIGAIESDGEYLLFCDSRMNPASDAVMNFKIVMEGTAVKVWLFGDKGSQKKNFVENFSFVRRQDYIDFGMCCERIDKYGGMSQEIRTRWAKQGGKFMYVEEARAEELVKSSMTPERRRQVIESKFKLLKMYKGENN